MSGKKKGGGKKDATGERGEKAKSKGGQPLWGVVVLLGVVGLAAVAFVRAARADETGVAIAHVVVGAFLIVGDLVYAARLGLFDPPDPDAPPEGLLVRLASAPGRTVIGAFRDGHLPLAFGSIAAFILAFHNFLGWHSGWFGWLVLVPYFLLVERLTTRRLLWVIPVLAFGQFMGGLYWIWNVTPPGLVTTSVLWCIYLTITSLVIRLARNELRVPLVIAGPVCWVAVEFVRSTFTFYKFPWLLIGHSQGESWALLQTADLWGPYGISFLLAMGSAVIATVLEMRRLGTLGAPGGPRRAALIAVGPAVAIVGATVYGMVRPHTIPIVDGPTVVLVQPSVPQAVKNDETGPSVELIFQEHLFLTAEGLIAYPDADLVSWSETMVFWPPNEAYPDYEGWWPDLDDWMKEEKDPRVRRRIRQHKDWAEDGDRKLREIAKGRLVSILEELADDKRLFRETRSQARDLAGRLREAFGEPEGGIDFVVGAVDRHPERPHNSAWFFRRGGEFGGRYDKINLVPLSEYVPFKESFRWLHDRLQSFVPPAFVSFEHGAGPAEFEVRSSGATADEAKSYIVSPHICFEVSFPELVRAQVLEGADVILSISNDAWFKRTAELDLARIHAIFRCVETRRGMARVVNAGISSIMDPLGRARDLVVDGELKEVRGVLGGVVPTSRVESFYVRHGDVFSNVVLTLALGFAVFGGAVAAMRRLRGDDGSSGETGS